MEPDISYDLREKLRDTLDELGISATDGYSELAVKEIIFELGYTKIVFAWDDCHDIRVKIPNNLSDRLTRAN